MQLFQSWKDSLKFFLPSNFKLFGLLTLNTTIKTYSVWLEYFWPLFVVSIAADVFPIFYFRIGSFHMSIGFLIGLLAKFALFVTLYLSLRPSVKKKTWDYFSDYKTHTLFIGLFFFVTVFLFHIFFGADSIRVDLFVSLYFFLFGFWLVPFFMLFYLDSRASFADLCFSFWRACKMFFFGWPFLLILAFIVYGISFLVSFLYFLVLYVSVKFLPFMVSEKPMLLVTSIMKHLFMLFSVPIISMVANFYTKRLHDQFKLYFLS